MNIFLAGFILVIISMAIYAYYFFNLKQKPQIEYIWVGNGDNPCKHMKD